MYEHSSLSFPPVLSLQSLQRVVLRHMHCSDFCTHSEPGLFPAGRALHSASMLRRQTLGANFRSYYRGFHYRRLLDFSEPPPRCVSASSTLELPFFSRNTPVGSRFLPKLCERPGHQPSLSRFLLPLMVPPDSFLSTSSLPLKDQGARFPVLSGPPSPLALSDS